MTISRAVGGMTLDIAESIASAAIRQAVASKYKPVTVVILDSYGYPVVTKRMDGCSPIGIPQFAHAKANTCIIMNLRTSNDLRLKYASANNSEQICQLNSMVAMTADKGGMAPFPGGCLITSKINKSSDTNGSGGLGGAGGVNGGDGGNEIIIGAIGVSGAAGAEDELCAFAGFDFYKNFVKEAEETKGTKKARKTKETKTQI